MEENGLSEVDSRRQVSGREQQAEVGQPSQRTKIRRQTYSPSLIRRK